MKRSDLARFAALLAGIGELYGKSLSEQWVDLYWRALESFEFEAVQSALQVHVTHPDVGQYFPKPADIVRGIVGSSQMQALQAWTQVEHAIRKVGAYQSLVFDDPLIHAVLEDMGGWIRLCSMTLSEMPFRANEFQQRYRGYVTKKPNRHPAYLCGITERENAKNGYATPAPWFIGETDKAKHVMLTGGGQPLLIQMSDVMEQAAHALLPQPEANDE